MNKFKRSTHEQDIVEIVRKLEQQFRQNNLNCKIVLQNGQEVVCNGQQIKLVFPHQVNQFPTLVG